MRGTVIVRALLADRKASSPRLTRIASSSSMRPRKIAPSGNTSTSMPARRSGRLERSIFLPRSDIKWVFIVAIVKTRLFSVQATVLAIRSVAMRKPKFMQSSSMSSSALRPRAMVVWNVWLAATPGCICALPHVRACRMLRRFEKSPCPQAFGVTGHPIISSFEPGEDWSWCFIDEVQVMLP